MNAKPPPPPTDAMTPMESWYLECLVRCTHKLRRAPVLHELAAFCKKSQTACYTALISLEHKGYVTRVGGAGDQRLKRRFCIVEVGQ